MLDLGRPDSAMTGAAWAKFDRISLEYWYPLWAHLEDTAAVADALYDSWLSPSQKKLLANAFGSGELAKRVAVWLAATHDVGKATPAFAIKADGQQYRMEQAGYVFPRNTPSPSEQSSFPHGRAGQIAIEDYFGDVADDFQKHRRLIRLAEIVGGHHGQFPTNPHQNIPSPYGAAEDPGWSTVRRDLLERAGRIAEISDEDWESIFSASITEPVQAILNGFLIVCDWIASNSDLFPYDTKRTASSQARQAIQSLSFGNHWVPRATENSNTYFDSRFGISSPRPVQSEALQVVEQLEEPSLVLVEAPTGEGKTELALGAAEILAKKFGLHGLIIALPTRATSDAMFGRVHRWLGRSIDEDSQVSAALVHGKAQFDELMQELPRVSPYRSIFEDDRPSSVVANSWFSGRKKNVFADFVVGTIDQLLFTALKSKHLSLRHLGLSGKVVVIDEVHAADTYMQTYLYRALEWLGAYGVPVVALSATLPPSQRKGLIEAYRRGANAPLNTGRRRTEVSDEFQKLADNASYPLITTVGGTHSDQTSPPRSARQTTYLIDEVEDEDLVDRVIESAENGGCIAVVLDTVDRAQKTYTQIKESFSGEVQLIHSRFTAESRSKNEKGLVDRLGPRSGSRPRSMIVVATQVIEASLDVDFDLMFTDFAPVDLLIQRMGRVHRHTRSLDERPSLMAEPRIILSGGSGILDDMVAPTFSKSIEKVYSRSLLYRSAISLRQLFDAKGKREVLVPEDVPSLIRSTYSDAVDVPEGWEPLFEDAEQKRRELEAVQQRRSRVFAIDPPGVGNIAAWSRASASEASEETASAQVRDSESSIEVVLVQKVGGRVLSLPWLTDGYAGQEVDNLTGIEPNLARQVARCTVALPSWLTFGNNLDRALDQLEANGVEGWQDSYWLRGVLPLVLDEEMRATLNNYSLRYDQERGLLVEGKLTND